MFSAPGNILVWGYNRGPIEPLQGQEEPNLPVPIHPVLPLPLEEQFNNGEPEDIINEPMAAEGILLLFVW